MGEEWNNYPGSISIEPNGELHTSTADISLNSSVHSANRNSERLRTTRTTHQLPIIMTTYSVVGRTAQYF